MPAVASATASLAHTQYSHPGPPENLFRPTFAVRLAVLGPRASGAPASCRHAFPVEQKEALN